MGRLTYDEVVSVDFDDRVLAHLQLVIGNKMRRGESFHFSWRDDVSTGDGRTIVWVHPRISIVYKFWGSKAPDINRDWVDVLMNSANTAAGLHLVPEPAHAETAPAERQHGVTARA